MTPISKEKQILKILDDLLKLDDIYACMVVRKKLEGIVPPVEKFNKKVIDLWDLLQSTMDKFFEVIERYTKYNLGEIYFRLMDYEAMFFILPQTDTALVAITPALANRGLLEVNMENARKKIIDILSK